MEGSGPDSAALRARRSRRHRAGDHSLCVAGRCAESGSPVPAAVAGAEPGGVLAAVTALVASLALPEKPGPRHVLAALALRLAAQADWPGADSAPAAVARELRAVLGEMFPAGTPRADDKLDDLAARRRRRRARLFPGG